MFGKNEEYITCQGCGKSFPKSKLKRCHSCGVVLCPKCRKKHVCKPFIRIENHTMGVGYNHSNPQCEIKISDMRIYELARFPALMTEEEREIIYNDFEIKRRYVHYQEIIEEKGY